MRAMFAQARAFNEPISFDTAKVTDVGVYLFGLTAMRNQILISVFPSNLLSDEEHVFLCSGLQSTAIFQYR